MKKISMNWSKTFGESFELFLISRRGKGVTEKTLLTYANHFRAISKHIDANQALTEIDNQAIDSMVSSMLDHGLARNTIRSYGITLRAFFIWCNAEGLSDLHVTPIKGEETIKETYTDAELKLLLEKPNIRTCNFAEYRTWVIINLLVNSGCRAATVRHIQIRDIDEGSHMIYARHTKNKKALVIPLCTSLITVLREYLRIRGGEPSDYLFCNDFGNQMTENCLRLSIARYNKQRGLTKTSIHLFRHTFAKKYLMDCGGNAFTLQKLLGHSTLDMTKHYCEIFNADIVREYDNFSPLEQMNAGKRKISITKKHNN